MMAGRASGAAVRRRERRLRSAWRHEQLSVAMALAAAAHHSAQPNAALRGQKPGTRAKEGVREERHVVEDPSELAPLVQFLDAPVPQMVDTVLEFFRALDLPVVEQVIAVPKISTDRVSQRLVERRLPQMVEQLVHVPTVLSPLRIAEQIVGIPAPQRGGNWSLPRTEFNVVAHAGTHFQADCGTDR